MGTVVSFDLRGPDDATLAAGLARACAVLHEDDATFSTWDPDSPMSRLRSGHLAPEVAPAVIAEVLGACQEAVALSEGWFDPCRMPGGMDPTGLVKGWSADRAAAALRAAGVEAAMLNAGGDIVVFGRPAPDRPWQVGVRQPSSPERFTCVAALEYPTVALATSGTYERGEHILDPFSGRPATALLSATVTGPQLALADALATGLLAAGPGGLRFVTAAGYEAWVVLPDGTTDATDAFPAVGDPPARR